jgi:membrane-bound lytic murein transglycosylase D
MGVVQQAAPTPVPTATTAPAAPNPPVDTIAPAIQSAGAPSNAAKSSAPVQVSAKHDTTRIAAADVKRRATEVFGESPDSAHADSAAGPSWDIEVRSYESTERVEHYVQLFTGPAKDRITARLERGTRYEPMIRAKLREGGLPEDMYYLALIESGFDPNAYSRAAAVGIWQFMTSTGRDMGLRVDWWVDERRDPIKSTGAAVRFIKGLREQFGSLYLAAAAYNGGPGRIARGLSRYAEDLEGTTGDDLFFALADKDYLRNETREYVPQLIAAALIAKEPARYDMNLTPRPVFAYDSVTVGPFTSLLSIAHASGSTIPQLQDLNPQFIRGITPPYDSTMVRVPVGTAVGFDSAFAALPKSEHVAVRTVVSKSGESVKTIASHAEITARELAFYNPKLRILKSGRLVPGQNVLVPTGAAVAAAAVVPDPSIERYSTSKTTTMHVVKSGETLSGIAKRYHTSTAALMKQNGLRRALIFSGQSLVVSTPSSKSKRTIVAEKHTGSSTSKRKVAHTSTKSLTNAKAAARTKSSKPSKKAKATGGKKPVARVAEKKAGQR